MAQLPPYQSGIYFTPVYPVTPGVFHYSPREPVHLPLLSVSFDAHIFPTSTSTTLTQTFHNPSTSFEALEACCSFQHYAHSTITSFICRIGPKTITGVLQPTQDARTTYDTAVARGLTAGIMETKTPEIFTTRIGNIPADTTVTITITYVGELHHSYHGDGILFTVPTAIAPRYGVPPPGVYGETSLRGPPEEGTTLSIAVTMASRIRGLSSSSHPVSIHLGTHSASVPGDDPTKALAVLHQPNTVLAHDFTLVINVATPPLAQLEEHPEGHALMVSLVPRFVASAGSMRDIVFLIDRSGSMHQHIAPLQAALRVFLKSLPLGCRFNLVSFGTHKTALWMGVVPYSRAALQEAEAYVDAVRANMGGTEMALAIRSVLREVVNGRETEVVVLTDGAVWGLEELCREVTAAREAAGRRVRVFSVGVGRGVSHALVEGIARAGGGVGVVVAPGEGLSEKVVGVLRCALSAHIDRCKLDIEYEADDNAEDSDSTVVGEKLTKRAPRNISLFDPELHPQDVIEQPDKKYPVPPSPLQAPFNIPPLFPFDRTTIYVLFSPGARTPKTVALRATTVDGDNLSLTTPVSTLEAPTTTIHSLAARTQLRDLETGQSWIHAAGHDERAVDREGERVGVKWGIAGRWTSFVTVETNDIHALDDPHVWARHALASMARQETVAAPRRSRRYDTGTLGSEPQQQQQQQSCRMEMQQDVSAFSGQSQAEHGAHRPPFGTGDVLRDYQMGLMTLQQQNKKRKRAALAPVEKTLLEKLVALQEFDGSFVYTRELAGLLQLADREADVFMGAAVRNATAVVAAYLEVRMEGMECVWVLVVEKAWAFVGVDEEVGRRARELVGG